MVVEIIRKPPFSSRVEFVPREKCDRPEIMLGKGNLLQINHLGRKATLKTEGHIKETYYRLVDGNGNSTDVDCIQILPDGPQKKDEPKPTVTPRKR